MRRCVTITNLRLRKDGTLPDGRDFGPGLPLYEIRGERALVHVRALSRGGAACFAVPQVRDALRTCLRDVAMVATEYKPALFRKAKCLARDIATLRAVGGAS